MANSASVTTKSAPAARPNLLRRAVQWPMQRGLLALSKLDLFLVRGMPKTNRIAAERFLRARYWSIATDYVRNSTLELLCRELRAKSVQGAIAEVGVYQGDFAALMHSHLPDRHIHLFDTFAGFDDRDVQRDAARVEVFFDFSNTSVNMVLDKFPDHAMVHVHPGWFPATAEHLSDLRFALVSLDADLFDPMLDGLRWFWPRLTPGGYIMAHDFNNDGFAGARQAIEQFAQDTAISYVPIPDWGGSVVIGKPARSLD